MSLDEHILDILENVDRPLKVSEITRQLSMKGHGIREQSVEHCLNGDLWERVRKRNARWELKSNASSASGSPAASADAEPQVDGTPSKKAGANDEAASTRTSQAGEKAAQEDLSHQIREMLEQQDQPLTVRQMQGLLFQRGYPTDGASVERCLRHTLSEHVRCDGLGRWSLRDDEAETFDPPENDLQNRIVRLLGEDGGKALTAPKIAEALSQKGATSVKVTADLFRLRRTGYVKQDQGERWYLTDVSLAERVAGEPDEASASEEPVARGEGPGIDEEEELTDLILNILESVEGELAGLILNILESVKERVRRDEQAGWHLAVSDEEAAPESEQATRKPSVPGKSGEKKETDRPTQQHEGESSRKLSDAQRAAGGISGDQVVQVLREANRALRASEITDRLDAPTTKKKVIQLLNPLYESGRVLLDQQYRWQLALDERSSIEPPKKETPDPDSEASPVFAPSGNAHAVTKLLECAKQVAVLLDLAPQPLSTGEMARLLRAMGFELKDKDVENVLGGPLRDHVEHTPEGWQLRADGEAGAAPPRDKTGTGVPPDRDELLAQTISDDMRYSFAQTEQDTPAFFSTSMAGGSNLRIQLNEDHPAYRYLKAVLRGENRETEAQTCLRLLLAGWARYEADLSDVQRHRAQQTRTDWGSVVRRLLRQSD